jgi:hypothetical protein
MQTKQNDFFTVNPKYNISPVQNLIAYIVGSAVQISLDNPLTSYRQMIQQYAKDASGNIVAPSIARA